MMKTLEMMNEAEKTDKTYISGDMRYSVEKGFHDGRGTPWEAEAFDTLNEVISLDSWRELSL